jgi:hypothetical protein
MKGGEIGRGGWNGDPIKLLMRDNGDPKENETETEDKRRRDNEVEGVSDNSRSLPFHRRDHRLSFLEPCDPESRGGNRFLDQRRLCGVSRAGSVDV